MGTVAVSLRAIAVRIRPTIFMVTLNDQHNGALLSVQLLSATGPLATEPAYRPTEQYAQSEVIAIHTSFVRVSLSGQVKGDLGPCRSVLPQLRDEIPAACSRCTADHSHAIGSGHLYDAIHAC